MMLRKPVLSFSVCIFLIWLAPVIWADIIPEGQIPMYAAKLGVKADMETLSYDRGTNRTQFSGTVLQVCKLKDLGFASAEIGESLEVTSLETGRWRAKIVASGKVKELDLSIDWAKDD